MKHTARQAAMHTWAVQSSSHSVELRSRARTSPTCVLDSTPVDLISPLMSTHQTNYNNSQANTSNVTTITEVQSASFGLVLHAHHIFANSFLITWRLPVINFHSTCIFGIVLANTAILRMRVRITCLMVRGAPWWVLLQHCIMQCCTHACCFTELCKEYLTKYKFGHHPHTLGYLCVKFCFFRGLRCWASPWRKIAYSITQLIWWPRNWSLCFEKWAFRQRTATISDRPKTTIKRICAGSQSQLMIAAVWTVCAWPAPGHWSTALLLPLHLISVFSLPISPFNKSILCNETPSASVLLHTVTYKHLTKCPSPTVNRTAATTLTDKLVKN